MTFTGGSGGGGGGGGGTQDIILGPIRTSGQVLNVITFLTKQNCRDKSETF